MAKKKTEREEKTGYRVMPIEKYIKAREKTKSPEFRKKLYEIREKQKE